MAAGIDPFGQVGEAYNVDQSAINLMEEFGTNNSGFNMTAFGGQETAKANANGFVWDQMAS